MDGQVVLIVHAENGLLYRHRWGLCFFGDPDRMGVCHQTFTNLHESYGEGCALTSAQLANCILVIVRLRRWNCKSR